MSDIAIRVENLSKLYHIGALRQRDDTLRDALTGMFRRGQNGAQRDDDTNLWALKDVSFEVKRGEVVGIIGRNGAGKSTLLKILSRITEPTSGHAEIHGRVGSLLEVGTGFHPELTGRENIYLNGAILGMRRSEIDRQFDAIVAFAEIERFLDTPVKRYSSGMYVRLAFAVAAHLEPEILLVDEVLAVGDAQFQKKCLGKMGDVAKEGRTVLFISHNMAAIENLCSQTALLEAGSMASFGATSEIIDHYLRTTHDAANSLPGSGASGEGIRLLSIGAVDMHGHSLPFARCGDDLNLALKFDVAASIPSVIVSVGFTSHYDTRVAAIRSDIAGYTLNLEEGNNVVICRMEDFPLVPGVYSLDVAVFVEEKPEIWAPALTSLTVESADFYHTGKLPDASWAGFTLLRQHWFMDGIR